MAYYAFEIDVACTDQRGNKLKIGAGEIIATASGVGTFYISPDCKTGSLDALDGQLVTTLEGVWKYIW
jgi:hypothetical protein